jgi:glycosyltransferase involved in cell wall biosynthesis
MKTISINIVTKNSLKNLIELYKSINEQDYLKTLIEVLVVDGGSKDKTREFCQKNSIRFIEAGYPENQEARRWIGINNSINEIVIMLDSDNILPKKNWITSMIEPFNNDENIKAAYTKWYCYSNVLSFYDRYNALMGGNDPIAYLLGKNDRNELFDNNTKKESCIIVYKKKNYDVIKFFVNSMPVIGCNGFLARRSYLLRSKIKNPESFFHTDVHYDLISENPDIHFAITNNCIIHKTSESLILNLRKRFIYKLIYSDDDKLASLRRYKIFNIYNKKDFISLVKVIIFSLLIIPYILSSLIKIYKTKKIEWIIHPFVIFSFLILYSFSYSVKIINKLKFTK